MTRKLSSWNSLGRIKGGVEVGRPDSAFVLTRTHSHWDTSSLVTAGPGQNNQLRATIDGITVGIVDLPSVPVLTIEELVALINLQFPQPTGYVFQASFRGGRLKIRSWTEGRGSLVDVSASDVEVLNILQFDQLSSGPRKIEDAPIAEGIENNPDGTYAFGYGEQFVRENVNRALAYTGHALDRAHGFLHGDYGVLRGPIEVDPADVVTMDDLGAPQKINVTPPGLPLPVLVGDSITQGPVTGVIYNLLDDAFIVHPITGGSFVVGPATVNGDAYSITSIERDERVRAIRLPVPLYAGDPERFGIPNAPTTFELHRYFDVHVRVVDGTLRSIASLSFSPTSYLNPPPAPYDVRPLAVCLGIPNHAYTPSNTYNFSGLLRQSTTPVLSWTRDRIYLDGGVDTTRVSPGDLITIAGSLTGSGVLLNNGTYVIAEATSAYVRVTTSLVTDTALGLPEEGVLEDAEIYPSASLPGVTAEIRSPSYLLNEKPSTTGSGHPYLFLNHPVALDPLLDTLMLRYTTVESLAGRKLGSSLQEEFVRSAVVKANEDLSRRLKAEELPTSALRENPSIEGPRDLGVLQREGVFSSSPLMEGVDGFGHEVDALRVEKVRGAGLLLQQGFDGDRQSAIGVSSVAEIDDESRPFFFQDPTNFVPTIIERHDVAPYRALIDRHAEARVLELTLTLTPPVVAFRQRIQDDVFGGTGYVLHQVLGDTLLVLVESGTFGAGNTVSQISPPMAIGTIDTVRVRGMVVGFQYGPETGVTLDFVADSFEVTATGSVGDLERFFEKMKSGDIVQVNPASTYDFSVRVQRVDPLAAKLILQTPSPLTATVVDFFCCADMGERRIIREAAGCDAVVANPAIKLQATTIPLHRLGVAPGDLLFIGASTEPLTIQRVFPDPTNFFASVVVVENAIDVIAVSGGAWYVTTQTSRTHGRRGVDFSTGSQYEYLAPRDREWWLLRGPAYAHVPMRSTTTLSGGIAPLSVGGFSGIAGKEITVEVFFGNKVAKSFTGNIPADYANPGALVAGLKTIFNTPGNLWFDVMLVEEPTPALVFYTTGVDETEETPLLGKGVRLVLRGAGWDALVAGNTGISYGAMSSILPVYSCLGWASFVDNPLVDFPFRWVGRATRMTVRTSFEEDSLYLSAHRDNPVMRTEAPDALLGYVEQERMYGGEIEGSVPSVVIADTDTRDFLHKTAVSVRKAGEEVASFGHDGAVSSRHATQSFRAEGALDNEGRVGVFPEPIYSGPLMIRGSLEGFVLRLLVGMTSHVVVKDVVFTSSENSLGTVIEAINYKLNEEPYAGWFICEKDGQGLGFVIRVDEQAIPDDTFGPSSTSNLFLQVDAQFTALQMRHGSDRSGNAFAGVWPGWEGIFQSSFLSARHSGAVDGVHVTRAGGRRLVSRSFSELRPGQTPRTHEAVWEERSENALALKNHFLWTDFKDSSLNDNLRNDVSAQDDLTIYGGSSSSPGEFLLYAWRTFADPELSLSRGELAVFGGTNPGIVIGDANPGGRRYFRLILTLGSTIGGGPGTRVMISTPNFAMYAEVESVSGGSSEVYELRVNTLFPHADIQVGYLVTNLTTTANAAVASLDGVFADTYWVRGHAGPETFGSLASLGVRVVVPKAVPPDGVWFYRPTLLLMDISTATVPPAVGDVVASDGAAEAVIGTSYSLGSNLRLFVLYQSTAGVREESIGVLTRSWVGTLVESGIPANIYGEILGAEHLLSDQHITAMRPIFTFSKHGLPLHEGQDRVSATSHGDLIVKNDFLWGAVTPTDIPSETPIGSTNFLRKNFSEFGRPTTVELLANEGVSVGDVSPPPTTLLFPAVDNMAAASVLLATVPASLATRSGAAGAPPYDFLLPGQAAWVPPLTALSGGTGDEDVYVSVDYTIPVPSEDAWVDGYGAYVHRSYDEPLPVAGMQRLPLIVALYHAKGQDKRVLDYAQPYHRLHVVNTDMESAVADTFMRVDSAGFGLSQQTYDWSVLAQGELAPSWAKTPGSTQWYPFTPFSMRSIREEMLDLYVRPLTGSYPRPTDIVQSLTAQGVWNRSAVVAYTDLFGEFASPKALRIKCYHGHSTTLAFPPGYPLNVNTTEHRTFPVDFPSYEPTLFQSGEVISWEDGLGGNLGTGVVHHVDRYPQGGHLKIRVYIPISRRDSGAYIRADALAGVYVRFKCKSVSLTRL